MKVETGLYTGQQVIIVGKTAKKPGDFAVNFCAGSDVAFHFNARFAGSRFGDEASAVRDCRVDGDWLRAESDGDFPLQLNTSFEMVIRCEEDGFRVAVDGEEFCFYEHHLDREEVDALEIVGDVKIYQVSLEQPGFLHSGSLRLWRPSLPLQESLRLAKGSHLTLRARCPPGGRFALNFLAGEDTAFHFNPRFDEGTVVRNSKTEEEGWGEEERDGGMPFKPTQAFHLLLIPETKRYAVFVDGHEFITYKHRIPMDQVDALQITGDLHVIELKLN